MAPTNQPGQPASPPADKPASEGQSVKLGTPAAQGGAPAAPAPAAPAASPPVPARPPFRMKRRTNGPDRFQSTEDKKKPMLVMQPQRNEPAARLPRQRVFNPRLVPLVPPGVTTNPSRQFQALLGLRPSGSLLPDPKRDGGPLPMPAPKPKELPPGIDKLLQTLPNARAQIIRQVLTGPESRLQRALTTFITDAAFQKLDFESQRRALAAFDLRY